MKAKPTILIKGKGYVPCEPEEATHVWLHVPGPFPDRAIPVTLDGSIAGRKGPIWMWNGNTEKPTLKPSILTRANIGRDENLAKNNGMPQLTVCHSWVTDGKIKFLGDSNHEFSGQTLDLLDCD